MFAGIVIFWGILFFLLSIDCHRAVSLLWRMEEEGILNVANHADT